MMDPIEPNALASGAPTSDFTIASNGEPGALATGVKRVHGSTPVADAPGSPLIVRAASLVGQRSARGGSSKSNKPLSASQALANVLGLHVRLHRQETSGPGDRDDHTAGVVTTVTTVTTPDEGGCEHDWTLRLGGRWGLLEAYCGKCGEVAVRRAA
jgi:hypothetical protein